MALSTPGIRRFMRLLALFAVFWVIGWSLGYPTLNRYDPGQTGVSDARYYAQMVEQGVINTPDVGHWRYRILIPALARPAYLVTKGHVGSWEPRYFALLVVNAALCAGAALVIFLLSESLAPGSPARLVAPFLFFLDFNTPNLYLSGLVDSGEVLTLALLFMALVRGAWNWMPAIGVIGALSKESSFVFFAATAGGWILYEMWDKRRIPWRPVIMTGLSLAASLATIALERLILGNGIQLIPLDVSSRTIEWSPWTVLQNVPQIFMTPALYYTFGWIVPLAILGWPRIPAQWRAAALTAFATGIVLSAWAGLGDNIGRPLFTATAVVLSIAAAFGLERLLERRT